MARLWGDVMGYYEFSREWCKYDALVRNRCEVINVVTEDRMTYQRSKGTCTVVFLGRVLAEYATSSLDGARDAFTRLDAVYRVLWDCRREGLAFFV